MAQWILRLWAARTKMLSMETIRFERFFRTPYSESYQILQGGGGVQEVGRLGAIDLHFTSTTVHGTLILERELAEPELTNLIEIIDEDLVLSAEVSRDDFLVTVYVGRSIGYYSDESFAEEGEVGVASLNGTVR